MKGFEHLLELFLKNSFGKFSQHGFSLVVFNLLPSERVMKAMQVVEALSEDECMRIESIHYYNLKRILDLDSFIESVQGLDALCGVVFVIEEESVEEAEHCLFWAYQNLPFVVPCWMVLVDFVGDAEVLGPEKTHRFAEERQA